MSPGTLILLCVWLEFTLLIDSSAAVFVPASFVNSDLAQMGGAGDSGAPLLTPDARFVLFASTANNLAPAQNGSTLPGSFPAFINIYVRDRQEGTTKLISANASGTASGQGDSLPLCISTNGGVVLFSSSAEDLVGNGTNDFADIFVRDTEQSLTFLVSVSTNGGPANGESQGAAMTPDGRYVAFISEARNLVPNDTNRLADVFVRDLLTATTAIASLDVPVVGAIRGSPEISDNGRYVAFYIGDTNRTMGSQICVRDLELGTTTVASSDAGAILLGLTGATRALSFGQALSASGEYVAFAVNSAPNTPSGLIVRYSMETGVTEVVHTNALLFGGPRGDSREVDITPDGRFIAFLASTNLLGTNIACVHVWDAQTGGSVLASVDLANTAAAGDFGRPRLDASGRFVAFVSTAANMITNTVTAGCHLYWRDLLLGRTELLDTSPTGIGMRAACFTRPQISKEGNCIAFQGADGAPIQNLAYWQVLLRSRTPAQTELVSVPHSDMAPSTGNGSSLGPPSLSQDGRYVAFTSLASDVAANDTNQNRDVFLRDLRAGTTILVSANTNGFAGHGMSFEPSISSDGRFVAFTSTAPDLSFGDRNEMRDVFVFDRLTRMTTRATNHSGYTPGFANKASFSPRISADGTSLFFVSKATNPLEPRYYLLWRNLETGKTLLLEGLGVTNHVISPTGRFAAYKVGDSVYLWDSFTQTRVYTNTSWYSPLAISPDGNRILVFSDTDLALWQRTPAQSNNLSASYSSKSKNACFSADNSYLLYASPSAQGFIDSNNALDVYLYHVPSATRLLVSHAWHSAASAANGSSALPAMSPDARFIVYVSTATNLVEIDTNRVSDVFVYDRLTGKNSMLLAAQRQAVAGQIFQCEFSSGGPTLVVPSWRSDFAAGDFNQAGDLFAYSFLSVSIEKPQGARPRISWPLFWGLDYEVEYKEEPNQQHWTTLGGEVVSTESSATVEDPAPDPERRIYRVIAF